MSTRPAKQPIGRQLALTAKLVGYEFNAALAEAGGSLPVWLVLQTIERHEWASQHRLAGALGIEGATLTRHLDSLEAAGLVVRRRDGADRRAIRVEATDAGRALYQRLLAAAIAFDERLRAGFDDGELEQLRELLLRIEGNLERTRPPAP